MEKFIGATKQKGTIQESIVWEDRYTIRVTYDSQNNMMHAHFLLVNNSLPNTYVSKDLTKSQYTSRSSCLYFPSAGSPFYMPIHSDPERVTVLVKQIEQFEQRLKQ